MLLSHKTALDYLIWSLVCSIIVVYCWCFIFLWDLIHSRVVSLSSNSAKITQWQIRAQFNRPSRRDQRAFWYNHTKQRLTNWIAVWNWCFHSVDRLMCRFFCRSSIRSSTSKVISLHFCHILLLFSFCFAIRSKALDIFCFIFVCVLYSQAIGRETPLTKRQRTKKVSRDNGERSEPCVLSMSTSFADTFLSLSCQFSYKKLMPWVELT